MQLGWGGDAFGSGGQATKLREVKQLTFDRIEVPSAEINRVLGGGIVPGSLVLVGGDPGIGKSTVLLQVAGAVAERGGGPVLYVSGEESAQQVALRAARLGIDCEELYLLSETSVEAVEEQIRALRPVIAIVDSIQVVYTEAHAASAGSLPQVRECAARLLRLAKTEGIPIFIVGHVNKAGEVAGPRVLEHIVDCVVYVEGERYSTLRLMRAVKNRFGSTDEVAVLEMGEGGLRDVANPSALFLSEGRAPAGSAVHVAVEGSRCLLVEVQALCTPTFGEAAAPRRNCNGVDVTRLYHLLAVLSKRARLSLYRQDVFVNVTGGLRLHEPASDLAVVAALVGSLRDASFPPGTCFLGEVGLGGELRPVAQLERRISEAAKLGFRRCIVPRAGHPGPGRVAKRGSGGAMEVVPCATILEAVDAALPPDPP
eukprot:tig00001154_g7278.t1